MAMRMKAAAPALGLLLSVCPFGSEPAGGFARIEGTVRAENGSPYRASITAACGGSVRFASTDGQGRYVVEYEVEHLLGPPDSAGMPRSPGAADTLTLPCRVSAGPRNAPPVAVRYADVLFHRDRGRRVETRVDLAKGWFDPEPPAQP